MDLKNAHDVKITANAFMKECQKLGMPAFLVYFVPEASKYEYHGIFPAEIGTDDVIGEEDRFDDFFRTVINWKEEKYLPKMNEHLKDNKQ